MDAPFHLFSFVICHAAKRVAEGATRCAFPSRSPQHPMATRATAGSGVATEGSQDVSSQPHRQIPQIAMGKSNRVFGSGHSRIVSSVAFGVRKWEHSSSWICRMRLEGIVSKRMGAPCRPVLLDHLIGAPEQHPRHRQADGLGGGQVDHKIELGRLLDRKIGGPRPSQNLVDIIGSTPVQVREVCSIRQQAENLPTDPDGLHNRDLLQTQPHCVRHSALPSRPSHLVGIGYEPGESYRN
jgi:hypothetical protein